MTDIQFQTKSFSKVSEVTSAVPILKDTTVITEIEVLMVETSNAQVVTQRVQQLGAFLALQPGFVAFALHLSLDQTHVLSYIQWQDQFSLEAAHAVAAKALDQDQLYQLVKSSDRDLYEVAYTFNRNPNELTTISTAYKGATFINLISTAPELQERLLEFIISNDKQGFSTSPGYHSANFHRGKSGKKVVNYSHWDQPSDFMLAIEKLLDQPNLTMEEANQAATVGARGVGRTDFRFYKVVWAIQAS